MSFVKRASHWENRSGKSSMEKGFSVSGVRWNVVTGVIAYDSW